MALKLRLSRAGRKKSPFYRVVVSDARSPRDGNFIERLGTYNPLLPKDSDQRIVLNTERVQYWLSQGAEPTERVAIFLGKLGIAPMPEQKNSPKKSQPKAKAQERLREKAAAEEAAAEAKKAEAEAAKAAAAAPAPAPEEAPAVEEVAAVEAPAEEAAAEEPKAE